MKGSKMKYELNTNELGQFNGYQSIIYNLEGSDIYECQFFDNGVFIPHMSFITVYQGSATGRDFSVSAWGTMEITRDAAELFAVNGWLNCIEKEINENTTHVQVKPNIEGEYLNA